jgi:predicted TIM-barrel fold metal-dependent hydrolase
MSVDEVLAAMDDAGVSRTYLVPANSAANPACLDAARRWPDRFRVMAIVGLDKPESRRLIAEWPSAGYIGVRLPFPPFRKVSWLKDGTADWFWPEADRLKLPVMIWAPEQTNEIARLAERYLNVRFIIDHLNLFVEDKGEKVVKAVSDILPLAKYPNVAAKASAMPAHSTEPYPYRDLHPYIEQVVRVFGARRVLWGTDLTRAACSYKQAITMFTEELRFLSPSDLEEIMGGAATRWIGW